MRKSEICYKRRFLDMVLVSVLFAVSFYYFLYGYQYFNLRTYHFDEAISAYGAERILDGGIPYRDFWSFHVPGRFYALAAAFKIFGVSLKTTKLLAVFIISVTSCGLYLFISKVCSRFVALLAFLLSLASMKLHMVYNRPGQFAVLFVVLSWFPLLSYIRSGKCRWLVITGIITGIIGVFRIDFAVYNSISLSLLILLKKMNDSRKECWNLRLNKIVKDAIHLFFGLFLTSLPNFLFFFLSGGFSEFKEYIMSGIELRNRYIPLPPLNFNTAIFYFPAAALLITGIRLLFYNSKDKGRDITFWLSLYFLFLGTFLYYYALMRTDIPHLTPVLMPIIALIVLHYGKFIRKIDKSAYNFKRLIWSVSLFVCFYFIFYSIKPYFGELRLISRQGDKIRLTIPRAYGFYDHSDLAQSQIAAIKYIQDKTNKNDKIFVGNLRYDRGVNNDVMFYFLSERDSATKYYQFEPGVITTRKVQQQIINDLIRENVVYIVLWTAAVGINEPNDSSKSSGIKDLDNFIHKYYKLEKRFDYYLILSRK